MLTTFNDTYINALLADASYVSSLSGATTPGSLATALTGRMTQCQADLISTNFLVLTQEISPTGGFDAVVRKGQENTP